MSYRAMNSIRHDLSSVLGPHVDKDHSIKRLFRGFYILGPTKPRFHYNWDIIMIYILNFIESN